MAAGLLAGLALLLAHPAAAELNEHGRREVAELLQRVEKSGCSFNRAGTWYTAGEARAHLQRKYDYLMARDMLGSAEDFIVKAATKSSMSGEPYMMRCANAPAVPSSSWIDAELRRMRQGAAR